MIERINLEPFILALIREASFDEVELKATPAEKQRVTLFQL